MSESEKTLQPYKVDGPHDRTRSYVGVPLGEIDSLDMTAKIPILGDFWVEYDRHEEAWICQVKEYHTDPKCGTSYMWYTSPPFRTGDDAQRYAIWAWERRLDTGYFTSAGMVWDDGLDEKGNRLFY